LNGHEPEAAVKLTIKQSTDPESSPLPGVEQGIPEPTPFDPVISPLIPGSDPEFGRVYESASGRILETTQRSERGSVAGVKVRNPFKWTPGQSDPAREASRLELLAEFGLASSVPKSSSPRSVLNLNDGLYLMHGGKASGKTVNALALYIDLVRAKSQMKARYVYAFEPRAKQVEPEPFGALKAYDKDMKEFIATCSGGVLVFDSLTYVLKGLNETPKEQGATYPGGLQERDFRAIRDHDRLAALHNVALIGIVNSDLLPISEDLEGACEGMIRVMGVGSMSIRDRITRRDIPLELSKLSLANALTILYPENI